jgi:nucleoside-diphosphate-sugar epimerase
MQRLFLFGLGYCGARIAARFEADGWEVISTGSAGTLRFDDASNVKIALADASHVLSTVPPSADGDPVLTGYGDALAGKWLGYLSSTGVYGDSGGAWVDETAATGTGRRTARAEADADWLARGAAVLRLPGIYGPGRSALERVREGKAHRIDLPGQVFSRVHVDDIVDACTRALKAAQGAYNVADDAPSSGNSVIEAASRLLGIEPPPLQSLDQASLSPQARAFYAENRRVSNFKAKRELGWTPRYPSYREGLRACLAAG